MVEGVLFVTALFVLYALLSRWLGRSMFTAPILFLVAGVFVGVDLLSEGTPLIDFAIKLDSEVIQSLLEATLVIVLFSDAVMIDYRAVRKEAFLPTRLLGFGLPLTVVLGTATAMLVFPEISIWDAAIIAIILAPTDAALGQAVVSNDEVPSMIRQGLGVESGLNDGIAVPFLTIAIAGAANEMQTARGIATVFIEEIGFAIVVGLVVGLLGGYLTVKATERGFAGREGQQVVVVFLALFAFALADVVGGSGFIAAFVGGISFGGLTRDRFPKIHHFAEGVGHLLTMLSIFVFGALLLAPQFELVTARTVLYALLSLTVIRALPVALALVGTGLRLPTVAFLGWFGPRGLASLVFIGTVVIGAGVEGTSEIVTVGTLTVGLSVILHGLTAWPASVQYAKWFSRCGEEDMAEQYDVEHLPFSALSPIGRAVMGSDDG